MVEGAALEKRCAGNGTKGSNPFLSAKTTQAYPPPSPKADTSPLVQLQLPAIAARENAANLGTKLFDQPMLFWEPPYSAS